MDTFMLSKTELRDTLVRKEYTWDAYVDSGEDLLAPGSLTMEILLPIGS